MKIGICTTDFRPRGMDELFGTIAGMGFACVQFAFASILESNFVESEAIEIPAEIPAGLPKAVADCAGAHGLEIVALNGTYNMAHPDREVRDEGARRFLKLIDAAAGMGVPYITLCTGSRSRESLWKRHPDNESEAASRDMADGMGKILPHAEKMGVTLLIETEASNTVRTPARARRLMDEMGSKNLRVVLDPANVFLPGMARPENVRAVLDDAFDRFGKDILLAHGKDIRAGEDIDFCGTGLGIVDFPYMLKRLSALGFAGDMVLHGIYDENDMPRALSYMERVAQNV